jgi:hypothetical protein
MKQGVVYKKFMIQWKIDPHHQCLRSHFAGDLPHHICALAFELALHVAASHWAWF